MRKVPTIVALASCVALAGCASTKSVYSNIYEGLKAREAIVRPSVERSPTGKSMSYGEYDANRKARLDDNERE